MLGIIVAVSDNNVIGKNNEIPWDCPEDMARFVTITKRHPIIMGRRTFKSIGKPLPGRINIVVTRKYIDLINVHSVNSLENALRVAESFSPMMPFVIGGTRLYAEALPIATHLFFTRIHQEVEGDTFFPPIEWTHWEQTEEEKHTSFTFSTWEHKDPWDIEY